jgi:hypothetical protein
MSGFSAKEFEPDPTIMPEDDKASGGASPGAGHNRIGKPTEHAKRCSGRCAAAAMRCAASMMRRGERTSGIIRTGFGRCYWSRPSGSKTRSR